jgi:hypothetical protein
LDPSFISKLFSEVALGCVREIVRHATIAKGVGFNVVAFTALGTLHGHRTVISVDDFELTLALVTLAVTRINQHGIAPQRKNETAIGGRLSSMDRSEDRMPAYGRLRNQEQPI